MRTSDAPLVTPTSFPYRVYAGDGGSPSLEVDLLGVNGVDISTLALVDTGAEWSVMPLDVGKRLGVDLSLCKQTEGQAGAGAATQWWWGQSPDGLARVRPMIRTAGWEVPIAPMLTERIDVVVLGRRDFLSSFRFAIDERAQTFSLDPYDEPVDDWLKRSGR